MKLLTLLAGNKKARRKTREEMQRKALEEAGKQQFQKLQELGLRIPVIAI
jgi:hypothetical protein